MYELIEIHNVDLANVHSMLKNQNDRVDIDDDEIQELVVEY